MNNSTHKMHEVRIMMALRFTDANTANALVKQLYGDFYNSKTHPQMFKHLKELKAAGYVNKREGINSQNRSINIWSVTEDQFADFMATLLYPEGRF